MMKAAHLIFETSAVPGVENRRRHEDKQVPLYTLIRAALEYIADNRNITEQGHLRPGLGLFILEQPANRERIAALDQDIGIKRSRIDHRARDRRACEGKRSITELIAVLWFHIKSDVIFFIQ